MAGLLDPGVRDPRDALAGRLVERVPEVVGRRVRFGVTAKVDAHAVAERRLAQVALDHPEHGGSLRVRDRVETLRSLLRALGLDGERVRGGARAAGGSAGAVSHALAPI